MDFGAPVPKSAQDVLNLCYLGQEHLAAQFFDLTLKTPHEGPVRRLLSEFFACQVSLGFAGDPRFSLEPRSHIGTKLSAVLITKNEEQFLEACLSSVSGLVDEIVVVDTGSTDRTVEIANSFGAVLGHFNWIQDFSAARNYALSLATGQWALWIDADEQLDAQSFSAIRWAISRPHFGGYSIEIVNRLSDGEADQFVHSPIRLFQCRPEVSFIGAIHEQVAPSLAALDLPIHPLEGARIWHDGYRPEIMEARDKNARTIQMLEAVVRREPENAFQAFNLANAYIVAGDLKAAVKAARRGLEILPKNAEYGQLLFQILITSLWQTHHYNDALEACDLADARGFGGLLTEFERANVLLRTGQLDEALHAIERSFSFAWPPNMPGDKGVELFKRHALKSQILAGLGRFEEALDWADRTLVIAPDHAGTLLNRALVLENLRRPEAKYAHERAILHPENALESSKGLGRLAFRTGDFALATLWFERALDLAPHDEAAWAYWQEAADALGDLDRANAMYASRAELTSHDFVNWGRLLAKKGLAQEAIEKFEQAIALDPNHANAYFNIGDLMYQYGQYADAIPVYQEALRLAPKHAEGWFVFGNALAQIDANEAAIRCYQETLRLQPNHAGAQNNLSVVAA